MKRVIGLVIVILVLATFACGPKEIPSTGSNRALSSIPSAKTGETTGLNNQQGDWEKMVSAARKEGKVVIYGTMGVDVKNALNAAFKEKYGISLEGISGSQGLIDEKIVREYKNGLNLSDVHIGGLTGIVGDLIPAGVLEPLAPVLILPEVKEPAFWYRGQIPWLDGDKDMLTFRMSLSVNTAFTVNTSIAQPSELRSLKDLLRPAWKGKIVMGDPSVPSAASTWFSFTVRKLGEDFQRELVKQQPMILRDERLIAEWVARGKYPVGLGVKNEYVYELIKAGTSLVKYAPQETYLTSSGSCISLIKKAPHPNAARVFINWLLSKEGQSLYSRMMQEQSAREDVPADFLELGGRRQPGVEYIQDSIEWAQKRVEYLALAREFYRP